MNNTSSYPTTGRIVLFFMGWFLIFPLIWGIVLWKRQNKLNTQYEMNINQKFNTKVIEINEYKQKIKDMKREQEETKRQFEEKYVNREKQLGIEKLSERLKFESSKKLWIEQITQKEKDFETQIHSKQAAADAEITKKEQIIASLEKEIADREEQARNVFRKKYEKINKLKKLISKLKKELVDLEDEALFQSFGFYKPQFDFETSKEYAKRLEEIRDAQKQMVKDKTATIHSEHWQLNGSYRKGRVMNNQNIKMVIRSFNYECDTIIQKVKFNNINVGVKKIRVSFDKINKLNKQNSISIHSDFLELKIQELYLAYEYAQKKQEEIEEQRRIRNLLKEERRVQQELEEELKKIRKEEQHLLNVLENKAHELNDTEKEKYKTRLQEIQQQIADIDYRVNNTKAGYVYIISNIGCFGENVYKIGMTRRLEPLERVRELGGASVPFHFDVHALIFSEDAPALEANLHRAFQDRRINKVNHRKEFFKVNLKEIKKVIYEAHDKPVQFKMIAEAKEFRETQMIERQVQQEQLKLSI